jgi:hypothetical protein
LDAKLPSHAPTPPLRNPEKTVFDPLEHDPLERDSSDCDPEDHDLSEHVYQAMFIRA